MPIIIGTSGWQYKDWRERFYPPKLPQKEWLEHYADRFAIVEINNTFYRLPEKQTFVDWKRRTPQDFVLAPKASRYLTHIKRLKDSAEPIKTFMERARGLGDKLGPILLQLPPNLKADPDLLNECLKNFPRSVRLTVEFRHDSWFVDEVKDVLSERGAAHCLADSPKRKTPIWRTADWTYLRLHEGQASPHPCYGKAALTTWVKKLQELWSGKSDVYVFFNNDTRGCALRDAVVFARAAEKAGLETTRVPEAGEVRAG